MPDIMSAQLGGLSYAVVPSTMYEEVHKSSPHVNLFRYEVKVPSTFEIIVLTMNRAKSVMRLLKSLEASEYGSEQIQLTIHVDYRAGNQDTVDIVKNYSWPHGSKRVVVRRANIGVIGRGSMRGRASQTDLLFSKMISPCLRNGICGCNVHGISTNLHGHGGNFNNAPDIDSKLPDWGFGAKLRMTMSRFCTKLMGSVGLSPHPKRWREFLDRWRN